MTTFEIKKSSTKTNNPKVPKLMLGCNLQNSMSWALNSSNSDMKSRKKKLKGYEMNTKSRELKLKKKTVSRKDIQPKKVLKLSKFNDYICNL